MPRPIVRGGWAGESMGAAEETCFLERLGRPGKWILSTHVQPDADGIGSQLALAWLIRLRGGDVRLINRDPVPGMLAAMDPGGQVEVYEPARHDPLLAAADCLVMVDNSEPARLGNLREAFMRSPAFKVTIDHHPDPDPAWDLLVLRQEASSTAEIVHSLILQAGETPDQATAELLYMALVSDTGRFRFANTSAAAFCMASALVCCGARPARVHAILEERLSAPFLKAFGETLAEMELRALGRLVVLRIPPARLGMMQQGGEDLSDVINEALRLETSRVAVLLREIQPGKTKISLRSKGPRDVNQMARRYGGGGHRNASGILIPLGMEEAFARLVSELEELALLPD